MSKHETGQGSFSPKVRPAKADYCSGAAVGRSGDAFGDHKGESIEKPTVLLGFFEGRTERAGLGLTDRVIAVRWSFLHPAAAARGCGRGSGPQPTKGEPAHQDRALRASSILLVDC